MMVNAVQSSSSVLGNKRGEDPALNSLGNNLWISTWFLTNFQSTPDAPSFGLAMAAINLFINDYEAGKLPPSTPYLTTLYEELTTKNGIITQSLADLAKAYVTSGFSPAGLTAYQKIVNDPIYDAFYNSIYEWGAKFGSFQPNPQKLVSTDLKNVLNDVKNGIDPQKYPQFLTDLNTIYGELTSSTPPLDGVCQALLNLLENPIPTTTATDTLANIASKGNTQGLGSLLLANMSLPSTMDKLITQIISMENW